MDPIASYHEARFEGRRRFDMYCDHLVVAGKEMFGQSYEGRVDLDLLASRTEVFRERNKYFKSGLWWLGLSLVANMVLVHGFGHGWTDRWPSLTVASAIVGVVMCLATLRKVEYVRFKDDAGQAVIEIARPKGSAEGFESFVAAVEAELARGGS